MTHLTLFLEMFKNDIIQEKELLGQLVYKIKGSNRAFIFSKEGKFLNK
jgi:hypothetical protein